MHEYLEEMAIKGDYEAVIKALDENNYPLRDMIYPNGMSFWFIFAMNGHLAALAQGIRDQRLIPELDRTPKDQATVFEYLIIYDKIKELFQAIEQKLFDPAELTSFGGETVYHLLAENNCDTLISAIEQNLFNPTQIRNQNRQTVFYSILKYDPSKLFEAITHDRLNVSILEFLSKDTAMWRIFKGKDAILESAFYYGILKLDQIKDFFKTDDPAMQLLTQINNQDNSSIRHTTHILWAYAILVQKLNSLSPEKDSEVYSFIQEELVCLFQYIYNNKYNYSHLGQINTWIVGKCYPCVISCFFQLELNHLDHIMQALDIEVRTSNTHSDDFIEMIHDLSHLYRERLRDEYSEDEAYKKCLPFVTYIINNDHKSKYPDFKKFWPDKLIAIVTDNPEASVDELQEIFDYKDLELKRQRLEMA